MDDALDALLAGSELQGVAQVLLKPVLKAIGDNVAPDALLAMLAELYPEMDSNDLQERLARAMFVAKVWGRLHA